MKKLIISLSLLASINIYAQPRIAGSFGVTSDKKVLGKAEIGYQFNKVVVNYELMNSIPRGYFLHGPTVGVVIKQHFIPFVGYSRVEFGNENSVDRYKNTVLSSNLRVNTWSVPVGLNYNYENFCVSSGFAAGKYKFFFLTVGVSNLFD